MYFEGRKELFEGLKIMQLEKEWKQYLVIRLDMSLAGAEPKRVWSYLDNVFTTLNRNTTLLCGRIALLP